MFHESVSSAASQKTTFYVEEIEVGGKLKHDALYCHKCPLLCWHLDLHTSFPWVTKYINMLQGKELGSLLSPNTQCTRSLDFGFFFKNIQIWISGRGGNVTYSLWSMALSLVCAGDVSWVKSDGGLFFFLLPHLAYYRYVVIWWVSRRLTLSYIRLFWDWFQTMHLGTQEVILA